MSRGLGTHQRAILAALAAGEVWSSIADIAEATGRGDRQVRAAVRSLESRGLALVRQGVVAYVPAEDGWQWVGRRRTNAERAVEDLTGFPVAALTATVRRWPRADRPVPGLVVADPARAAEEEREVRRRAGLVSAGLRVEDTRSS